MPIRTAPTYPCGDRHFPRDTGATVVEQRFEATLAIALQDAGEGGQMLLRTLASVSDSFACALAAIIASACIRASRSPLNAVDVAPNFYLA